MSKKSILLFLALLLPILIFLFLKMFGRNKFDIPIYYTMRADSLNNVCGTKYKDPYTISDSILNKTHWTPGPATIWVFDGSANSNELKRLSDSFEPKEFSIVDVRSLYGTLPGSDRWMSCAFFVQTDKVIVLMDGEKRIRGYYTSGSLDEMDRLIVEMKILLKKY